MRKSTFASLLFAITAFMSTNMPHLQADVIATTEDVMTSAFFQGTDLVRGYAGDSRSTFRVGSNIAFGAGPETVYLQFSAADFSGYTAPVHNAMLSMTSVAGGFGADASAGNPFLVSAHAVTANPFTSITDDTNASGSISWSDFFANNIASANAESITSIEGFGVVEFDVTSIVNDWIDGSNTVLSIAMTGKTDPHTGNGGNGYLHGFSNSSESAGATFLTVTAVPEPCSTTALALLAGGFSLSRRRKR